MSRLVRCYMVLVLLSLAMEVKLFPFEALSVQSVPLSLLLFLLGLFFPLRKPHDFFQMVREKKILLLLTGLFFLSGLASALFSPFPAIHGIKALLRYGLFTGISFLFFFLISFEGKKTGLFFLQAVVGIAILLGLISLAEASSEGLFRFLTDTFRGSEYQAIDGRYRVGATLTHPNVFGCFMSLAILVFLYLKQESNQKGIVFYPAVSLLAAAMALSGSRNAAFMLLASVPLLLCNRKTAGTAARVMGICLCMTLILTPSLARFTDAWHYVAGIQKDPSRNLEATRQSPVASIPQKPSGSAYNPASNRALMWQGAVKMFHDHPLFGIGPGQYNFALKDYAPPALMAMELEKEKILQGSLNAHNGFFNILAEFGIMGMIVLLTGMAYLLRLLYRQSALYPPLPSHVLLAGFLLSFGPDAFLYNLLYMVVGLTCLLLFCYPESPGVDRMPAIPAKEPAS